MSAIEGWHAIYDYLHNRYRQSQSDCRSGYKKLGYTEKSAITDANHPLSRQRLNIPGVQGLSQTRAIESRLTAVFIVSVPYFLSSDPDLSVTVLLAKGCDKLLSE